MLDDPDDLDAYDRPERPCPAHADDPRQAARRTVAWLRDLDQWWALVAVAERTHSDLRARPARYDLYGWDPAQWIGDLVDDLDDDPVPVDDGTSAG